MTRPNSHHADFWIVLPVHNRKDTTLACLQTLSEIGALDWASIVVVDDGSSDGTSQAIASSFPQVALLHGDGNLWWGGAITKGMNHAFDRGAKCIFWLNDDCHPAPDSLKKLANFAVAEGGIACGPVYKNNTLHYTGYKKTRFSLRALEPQKAGIKKCDCSNGNLVAISRTVVERIGYPETVRFPQVFADTDYGMRATAAGIPYVVLWDAYGYDRAPEKRGEQSWLRSDISFSEVFAMTFDIRSPNYWKARLYYFPKHWGWRGGLVFFEAYIRAVVIFLMKFLRSFISPKRKG